MPGTARYLVLSASFTEFCVLIQYYCKALHVVTLPHCAHVECKVSLSVDSNAFTKLTGHHYIQPFIFPWSICPHLFWAQSTVHILLAWIKTAGKWVNVMWYNSQSLSPPGSSPKRILPKICSDGVWWCFLAPLDFPSLYKWLQIKDSLIYVCMNPCSSFIFKVCIVKKKVVLGFFRTQQQYPDCHVQARERLMFIDVFCFLVIISCIFGFVPPLSWNGHKCVKVVFIIKIPLFSKCRIFFM